MEIPCDYRACSFVDKKVYSCEFLNQNIPDNIQIIPSGTHLLNQQGNKLTNQVVIGVIFNKCNLTKVPQGLTRIFPRMKILSIWSSTLKTVTKIDLAEYKNIERIGFCNNLIEYLPGDLFEGFKNLEEVSFNGNKLKLIEPNILDELDKLNTVSFEANPAYSKCFSEKQGFESNATLVEVKRELFVRFCKDYKNIKDLLKVKKQNLTLNNTIDFQSQEICNLKYEIKGLNNIIQGLQDEMDKIKNQVQNNPHQSQSDIKTFLQTVETFKDFRIQIDNREFPVHKFLLAARSPTLAEILKNNPEVENLNLVDISVEIFEIILKFFYTDELPDDDGTNFLELFAAAGRLKIGELKNYAAGKLIDRIGKENSLDILKLSNKYDHEGLRQSAFDKVKECHPKIEFKDEWAEDVDTVIKIIEAYKMKEEAIKKVEEEFKNLIINS